MASICERLTDQRAALRRARTERTSRVEEAGDRSERPQDVRSTGRAARACSCSGASTPPPGPLRCPPSARREAVGPSRLRFRPTDTEARSRSDRVTGPDGARSTSRRQLRPGVEPHSMGSWTWRGLAQPGAAAPRGLPRPRNPARAEPVSERRAYRLVTTNERRGLPPEMSHAAQLRAAFEGCPRALRPGLRQIPRGRSELPVDPRGFAL